jgi:hypothetical protein
MEANRTQTEPTAERRKAAAADEIMSTESRTKHLIIVSTGADKSISIKFL